MITLLCILLLLAQAESRWVVEIGLMQYVNENSRAIENFNRPGQCCDGITTECSNECDNYFIFCLQQTNEIGLDSCSYGRYDTDGVGGDNLSFMYKNTIDDSTTNPLKFTGNQWPSNNITQFAVYTYDDDVFSDDDLVGIGTSNLALNTAQQSPVQVIVTSVFYQLSLNYTTYCDANYYGVTCNLHCIPTDDATGHFTCTSNGDKQCIEGYVGEDTNCTTVSCDLECTDANAYCNSSNVCVCVDGWSGERCEVPVCDPKCQNEGTCIAPNICQCFNGLSGSQCQVCESTSCTPKVSAANMGTILLVSSSLEPSVTIMHDKIVESINQGLLIGLIFGAVCTVIILTSALVIIIVAIQQKTWSGKRSMRKSETAVVTEESFVTVFDKVGPGDNPNYSPVVAQPVNVSTPRNGSMKSGLDNPLYTINSPTTSALIPVSNTNKEILAGYSLVSLPEDEQVYYSSVDGPINSYKPPPITRPNLTLKPLYYSQPVLNNGNTNSSEYDYAEAKSCLNIKDKGSSESEFYEHYEFYRE